MRGTDNKGRSSRHGERKSEIPSAELVITGKGETNDSHSPLAVRQPCMRHIEWDISFINARGEEGGRYGNTVRLVPAQPGVRIKWIFVET